MEPGGGNSKDTSKLNEKDTPSSKGRFKNLGRTSAQSGPSNKGSKQHRGNKSGGSGRKNHDAGRWKQEMKPEAILFRSLREAEGHFDKLGYTKSGRNVHVGATVWYVPKDRKYELRNMTKPENKNIKSNHCARAVQIVLWRNGKWAVPGGAVGTTETAVEALTREFHEKTGFRFPFSECHHLYSGVRTDSAFMTHTFGVVTQDEAFFDQIAMCRIKRGIMIDDVFGKVCVPVFMEKYKNRRGDVIVEGLPKYCQDEGSFEPLMKNATRTSFMLSMFCIGLMDDKALEQLCKLAKIPRLPQVYFQNLGRGNTILRPIRPVSHSSAGPHELESEEQKDPDKNLIDPVDLLARSEPREESFQDHVACVLSQLKLPVEESPQNKEEREKRVGRVQKILASIETSTST